MAEDPDTKQPDMDKSVAYDGGNGGDDDGGGDRDVLELSLDTQKEIQYESDVDDGNGDGDAAATGTIDTADSNTTSDSSSDSLGESKGTRQKRKPKTLPDGKSGPIVVDASDHIAGRLSSFVAKMLLRGERVSLVNCERIMISGTRKNTIHEYRQFLKINSIINPKHGPVHYRRPDTVITKMIRGMLPFEKKSSGKTAHKRLRAYVGSPKELKQFRKVQFEKAKITRPSSSYTTMGELCRVIGWTE